MTERTISELLLLSVKAHNSGNLTEAEHHYSAILAKQPTHADANHNLGLIASQSGKSEYALRLFKNAIKNNSGNEQFWISYIEELFNQKKFSECEGAIKRADKKIKRFDLSLKWLEFAGSVYLRLKRFKRAKYYLNFAKKLDRTNVSILNNYAICEKKLGNINGALRIYRSILKLEPCNAYAYYNSGLIHDEQEQLSDAIACYKKATELLPSYISAHNNLGNVYRRAGLIHKALQCYQDTVNLDPNHRNAKHMLNSLLEKKVSAPPEEYVTGLFDGFAPTFEKKLISQLGYDAPRALVEILKPHLFSNSVEKILDIGCGTGVAGKYLDGICDKIIGVDLSVKMIEKAKEKDTYAELHAGNYLDLLVKTNEKFNVFFATDVFIYIGDLAETFKIISETCCGDELFAFTTEHMDGNDFKLLPTGRFAHSFAYIDKLVAQNDFRMLEFQKLPLRMEEKEWLTGGFYVLAPN